MNATIEAARLQLNKMPLSELQQHFKDQDNERIIARLFDQLQIDELNGFVKKNQRAIAAYLPDSGDRNPLSDAQILGNLYIKPTLLRVEPCDGRAWQTADPSSLDKRSREEESAPAENDRREAVLQRQRETFHETTEGIRGEKQRQVAVFLAQLLVQAKHRENFIQSLLRTKTGRFNTVALEKALAETGVHVSRKVLTRFLDRFNKGNEVEKTTIESLEARLEELSECHRRLTRDDHDPVLRRRTGYLLLPVVRADASKAFKLMHGVDTVTPMAESGSADAVQDNLLDFLRSYMSDELDLHPVEDLAFVLADHSAPIIRSVAGAKATHALLGPHSYGGVFAMHSLGILAYDLMDAAEYKRFFDHVIEQLGQLDAQEAASDSVSFSLPSLAYAKNAAHFNIATRHHEVALEAINAGASPASAIGVAWDAIASFNAEAANESGYSEMLAEHAGVALKAGLPEQARHAWKLIEERGQEPGEVLARLAKIQSEPDLVANAEDAAVTLGMLPARR